MYILELHQDNLCMATYEAEQLLNCKLTLIEGKFYQTTALDESKVRRLAYTQRVFKQQTRFVTASYKIVFLNYENSAEPMNTTEGVPENAKQHFDAIYAIAKTKNGEQAKIVMKNPESIIGVLNINKTANTPSQIYAIELFENSKSYMTRRAHLREKVHPSGISPKLAKAMINISQAKKEIFDPFCGTGGILIEAMHNDLHSFGSDVEQDMVNHARINLDAEVEANPSLEKFKPQTEVQNALTYQPEGEEKQNKKDKQIIVCDPPYGKNTKSINIVEFYTAFFTNAKSYAETIVFCAPHWLDAEQVLRNTGWNIQKKCTQYIHKSLTRHIFHITLQ